GEVEDGHEPGRPAASGRGAAGLVQGEADQAAAVVGGDGEGGDVPGAGGVERCARGSGSPGAGGRARRGAAGGHTPDAGQVVEALEVGRGRGRGRGRAGGGGGQDQAHGADGQVPAVVEHAGEQAGRFVRPVFRGE